MGNDNEWRFGYPKPNACPYLRIKCTTCQLKVEPYDEERNSTHRVMLIGQDPRIEIDAIERVNKVLMLDVEEELHKWIRDDVLGPKAFTFVTIYATNAVKCILNGRPTIDRLNHYFSFCKSHLIKEISRFRPTLVLTFGKWTHKVFWKTFLQDSNIPYEMKKAFNGSLYSFRNSSYCFDYSPSLHMKQYKWALQGKLPNTHKCYEPAVHILKKTLQDYFKNPSP